MTPTDHFHTAIVTDDFEAVQAAIADALGHRWCEEVRYDVPIRYPSGEEASFPLAFAYTMTEPHLELIRSVPGTLWSPVAGSGIHHLGVWSDNVESDSARLVASGSPVEVFGVGPDGAPYWAYHRGAQGPRIEIVSRQVEPAFRQYWETGRMLDRPAGSGRRVPTDMGDRPCGATTAILLGVYGY